MSVDRLDILNRFKSCIQSNTEATDMELWGLDANGFCNFLLIGGKYKDIAEEAFCDVFEDDGRVLSVREFTDESDDVCFIKEIPPCQKMFDWLYNVLRHCKNEFANYSSIIWETLHLYQGDDEQGNWELSFEVGLYNENGECVERCHKLYATFIEGDDNSEYGGYFTRSETFHDVFEDAIRVLG